MNTIIVMKLYRNEIIFCFRSKLEIIMIIFNFKLTIQKNKKNSLFYKVLKKTYI